MDIYPTKLDIEVEGNLVIHWNDQSQQKVPVKVLRDRCPCSLCKEQESGDEKNEPSSPFNILSDVEVKPLRIQSMKPVGNYGYKITFSDGHSNGIYSFEFLKSLS